MFKDGVFVFCCSQIYDLTMILKNGKAKLEKREREEGFQFCNEEQRLPLLVSKMGNYSGNDLMGTMHDVQVCEDS